MANEAGCDLRSRCLLVPVEPFVWELVGRPGEPEQSFELRSEEAIMLLDNAVDEAKKAGLPWVEEDIILQPYEGMVKLYQESRRTDIEGKGK